MKINCTQTITADINPLALFSAYETALLSKILELLRHLMFQPEYDDEIVSVVVKKDKSNNNKTVVYGVTNYTSRKAATEIDITKYCDNETLELINFYTDAKRLNEKILKNKFELDDLDFK